MPILRRNRANDPQRAANSAANKRKAAKKKKIAAIRKKLKVGKIRNAPNHEHLRSKVSGAVKRANHIESGKTRMAIFEDNDGVKIFIRRVEAGKEQELANTLSAVIDRFSGSQERADNANVKAVVIALDDLSNLDAVEKAINNLTDPRIQSVSFNKDNEISKFKKHNGIPEADPASNVSPITHLKDYLTKESGNRSNKAYVNILRLLDASIKEEQSLNRDQNKKQFDIAQLFSLRNQIGAEMKAAASTSRSDRKAEKRNLALKNTLAMLDHHIMGKSWATGTMSVNDQKMVASAKDMNAIQNKIDTMKANGVDLTPNQAWSLVAADKKGSVDSVKNKAKLKKRIQDYAWGKNYTDQDINAALDHLKNYQVVTSYQLGKDIGGRQLGDILLSSDSFKNFWETHTSQANPDVKHRAASEEAMGFAQEFTTKEGQNPNVTEPDNPLGLPKYAALQSPQESDGIQKYGLSSVKWKDAVKQRSTLAPGDTFTAINQQNFTSYNYPESILANADEWILQLAMAEATGGVKDKAFADKNKDNALRGFQGYIENQIHGRLDWTDIETFTIGYGKKEGTDKAWAQDFARKLQQFQEKNNLDFDIRIRYQQGDEPVYDQIPSVNPVYTRPPAQADSDYDGFPLESFSGDARGLSRSDSDMSLVSDLGTDDNTQDDTDDDLLLDALSNPPSSPEEIRKQQQQFAENAANMKRALKVGIAAEIEQRVKDGMSRTEATEQALKVSDWPPVSRQKAKQQSNY